MKKVKDYIGVISITYMVIVLFLIVNLFIIKKPYINLITQDVAKEEQSVLKLEVKSIKNPVCRVVIEDLLTKYTDNNFDGKVKISQLYDYVLTSNVIDDYDNVKKKCNISNQKLDAYDIQNKYLTMMALRQNIVSNYFYQYELRFTDEVSCSYYDNLAQVSYNALKYTENELINDYVKMLGDN